MSFPARVLAIVAADESARGLPGGKVVDFPCIGGETDEMVDGASYWLDDEEPEQAPPPPMAALPAEWPAPHSD